MAETTTYARGGFRFFDSVKAGLMASVVLAVVMALLGTNTMKMLGTMLVGADASTVMLYTSGGILFFAIGIFYGIVYALILAPIKAFNALTKAVIYSVILTAISFYAGPKMPEMISKIKGETMEMKGAMNPCNPCAMRDHAMNPCAMKNRAMNPCNPCAMNPCNPCGGKINKKALVKSWINHLIYALVLGVMYRRMKVS